MLHREAKNNLDWPCWVSPPILLLLDHILLSNHISSNCLWCNHAVPMQWSLQNTPKDRVWGASRSLSMWLFLDSNVTYPERAYILCTHFPMTCPTHLFVCFIITRECKKFFPEFCKKGVVETPTHSQYVQNTSNTNWNLWTALVGGWKIGPSGSGSRCCLYVNSTRAKLYERTPS